VKATGGDHQRQPACRITAGAQLIDHRRTGYPPLSVVTACRELVDTLPAVDSDALAARLSLIRPYLDERAWRLLLGTEATVLGRGAR
jgi:hypothetical protein